MAMIRKAMFAFPIFINWLLIHSCTMIESGGPLPGKIAVRKLMEDECFIYVDSDVSKSSFKVRKDKEVQYSGFTWLNKKDAFIGTEVIDRSNRNKHRSNIAQFDLSGKLIDRIYEAEKGELAWPSYSSWDDKYLLFTTHRIADSAHPFEGLTPMLSLMIMELDQKKVIKRIDSIGRSPNFKIEESPWLYEGYQFVYSLDGGTKLRLEGQEELINPVEDTEGIYLFDVLTGKRKLLVPGGRSAIASPTSNQIAYEKDNSIRVLDLNTHQEKKIYEYSSKSNVQGTHWTPDGKCIYLVYKYSWGLSDLFHMGEKLIEVSTGKEIAFKSIKHGYDIYTWK